jgi:hypothetical protein
VEVAPLCMIVRMLEVCDRVWIIRERVVRRVCACSVSLSMGRGMGGRYLRLFLCARRAH